MGADWVELDMRRTADDRLAVHHGARLPDGRAIAAVSATGLPPAVPLLDVALDSCGEMGVNIEIKNTPGEPDHDVGQSVASAVVTLLADRDDQRDLLVSSFDPQAVAAVRRADPTILTASLVVDPGPATPAADLAAEAGNVALHPNEAFVDRYLVEVLHGADVAVNVWTVDDESRMVVLASIGVDGIITNRPDLARRVLDQSQREA